MISLLKIEQLDQLIENALTNVTPINKNSVSNPNLQSDQEIEKIKKPIDDFFKKAEKEETDSIDYNNKLKNIIHDPNQRKIRDTQIARSKTKMQDIKKIQNDFLVQQDALLQQQKQQQLKLQQDLKNMQAEKEEMELMLRQQIRESLDEFPDIHKYDSLPIMKRSLPHIEEIGQPVVQPNVGMQAPAPKKKIVVSFDTKTDHPYKVEFTERGFLIGTTRLSFEIIEAALSKNFSITLDGGSGMVLDAIKMQKILKYKDRI